MWIGIAAGLGAGAMWGLSFIAPLAVAPYTAFDVTAGRYVVYGVSSALILLVARRDALRTLAAADWRTALWLGLLGYVVYYLFVAFAVQLAGAALPALVVGCLPILLAVYANIRAQAIAWRALLAPLAAIAAGLALVNLEAALHAPTVESRWALAAGLALAVGATLVWMWYAIVNADALKRLPSMDAVAWAGLTGLGAGAGMVLLGLPGIAMGLSQIPELGLLRAEAIPLILWSLATGLLSSWFATYLWSLAAQRLPLALSAQLIVSETLFALLFGFIYVERFPTGFEAAGATLLVAGVMLGTYRFYQAR
jgi:drug/metabolite transporter (DMT)-like permease